MAILALTVWFAADTQSLCNPEVFPDQTHRIGF